MSQVYPPRYDDNPLPGKTKHLTFVHGLGVDGRMWINILPHFRGVCQLFNPDLPGFGQTPALPVTGGRPLEEAARWLAGEIRRNGAEKTTLVGYSMGVTVSVLTALQNPGLVESMVLIAGGVDWGRGARKWFKPFAGPAARFLMGRAYREIVRLTGDESLLPIVRDMIARADPAASSALLKDMLSTNLTGRLEEIDCPVLVAGGGRDMQATMTGVRTLSAGIRGSRLVVFPEDGHYLLLSRERELVKLLGEFMGNGDETR